MTPVGFGGAALTEAAAGGFGSSFGSRKKNSMYVMFVVGCVSLDSLESSHILQTVLVLL
jgi:hypothetical protein